MANKVNNTEMSNVLNVTLFKLAVLNKTHTIFKSKIYAHFVITATKNILLTCREFSGRYG